MLTNLILLTLDFVFCYSSNNNTFTCLIPGEVVSPVYQRPPIYSDNTIAASAGAACIKKILRLTVIAP
ncbi:hypothetical protein MgSA37_00897 [Mucilaginibacter gotjawali]|uniref:Uncharacterized protein n=1 Tax=Mucilaginibacter gotjawali TaxID=1550579 RepID=A0A0X8X319_9SPHI|nr:hypothetical protein MgSA37_00897 [Mucilaginibacter gotjawali]